MKWKNVYLFLIIGLSFLLPYMIGSSLLFPELAFFKISAPSGAFKTLMVLVFLATLAAMVPVLPLVFINCIPPVISFISLKIVNSSERQPMLYIFVAYHLLFAITIYFTIKAGRGIVNEKE